MNLRRVSTLLAEQIHEVLRHRRDWLDGSHDGELYDEDQVARRACQSSAALLAHAAELWQARRAVQMAERVLNVVLYEARDRCPVCDWYGQHEEDSECELAALLPRST